MGRFLLVFSPAAGHPRRDAVHAVSNLNLIPGPFPTWLICLYSPPAGWPRRRALRRPRALPAYLSRFFPFASRVVLLNSLAEMVRTGIGLSREPRLSTGPCSSRGRRRGTDRRWMPSS